MKNTLFGIIFLLTFSGQTQNLQWAHSMGGSGYDRGRVVQMDASKNVFLLGNYSGAVDFDPGVGTVLDASGGAFITKLDSLGNFVWTKSLGGTSTEGLCFNLDALGNIYLSGNFSGTVDFDPGPATFNLTSFGSADIFMLKLDALGGNFVWAKQIGGTSAEEAQSIITDGMGNIYFTGYFMGTCDFDPGPGVTSYTSAGFQNLFVAKLGPTGNFLWAKHINTNSGTGYSLDIDHIGNVIIGGTFSGSGDFNPGAGTLLLTSSGGSTDGFILKLDATGNFVWAKSFSGSGSDQLNSVRIDSDDNILSTGAFSSSCDFDPGIGSYLLSSPDGFEIYVSKLNASGDFIWAKVFEGGSSSDIGYAIDIDSSDNVYIAGGFKDTVDFDPGPAIYNIVTSPTNVSAYLTKLNTNGNFLFAFSIEDTLGEWIQSIDVSNIGEICLTGNYSGTIDVNPGDSIFNLVSSGSLDLFCAKYFQPICANLAMVVDSVQNPGCLSLGHIFSHAEGGVWPYSYEWNTIPSIYDSTAVVEAAGIYTIGTIDAYGCMKNSTIVVDGSIEEQDLDVNLLTDNFRPGFNSNIWINGYNRGCTTATGTLSVILSPLVIYNSTIPIPDAISGDTLKWNFTSLTYDSAHITPQIDVTTSASAAIGDSICFTVMITPTTGDADTTNNVKYYCFPVLNGYDPNDKKVYPQGECANHFVLNDQKLTYTVRFQNTGNADAVNIHILDTLDSDLDLNSVRVIGNSHDLITEVLPGHVLKFRFDNIHLPDSTADEVNSHGYVIFEVAPLPGLPYGTMVENTSAIYFDFNPAVITNTTFNTYADSIPHQSLSQSVSVECGDDYVFPDGYILSDIDSTISHISYLSSVLFCDSIITITVSVDPLNTTVLQSGTTLTAASGYTYQWVDCVTSTILPGETSQSFTALANGDYAVVVINGTCSDTSACYSIVTTAMGDWDKGAGINVYPNPANESITISTEIVAEHISLLDLSGRQILNIQPTGTNTVINLSALQKGIYFVKVITAEGERTVKVIKQ